MANRLNDILCAIDESAQFKRSFEKSRLVMAARQCLKDKIKVIVKKSINWYSLRPSGHYALFAPESSVVYLELDNARKEIVEFSSEHVVLYTILTVGKEKYETVVKFKLIECNSGSFKVNHLTEADCKSTFKNYLKLKEFVLKSRIDRVAVNSACILEVSSLGWLVGKRTFLWVEKRLTSFQKFLSQPNGSIPVDKIARERFVTSCSEEPLQRLQEFIYKESGQAFTVCDLQGSKTAKVTSSHNGLFDHVETGARWAKGGMLWAGPLGFLLGGLFGFLIGNSINQSGDFYILADVEFTNTMHKFGFDEHRLINAYKDNVEELKQLRQEAALKAEQEKIRREKAQRRAERLNELAALQAKLVRQRRECRTLKGAVILGQVLLLLSVCSLLIGDSSIQSALEYALTLGPLMTLFYACQQNVRCTLPLALIVGLWELFLWLGGALMVKIFTFSFVLIVTPIGAVYLWCKHT